MYVFEGHRIAPFSHKICPFDHIIAPFEHLQPLRTPSTPSNPFNTFGQIQSPSATFAPASLNSCTSSAFSESLSANHPFDLVDLVGCHALCGVRYINICMLPDSCTSEDIVLHAAWSLEAIAVCYITKGGQVYGEWHWWCVRIPWTSWDDMSDVWLWVCRKNLRFITILKISPLAIWGWFFV